MIAVFGTSLLNASLASAGYDCVLRAGGVARLSEPSLIELAVPLLAGSSANRTHWVLGTGQSVAS